MIKRLYNYILHRRPHAEGVQRALTAPDKASQDSKPGMFGLLALAELDKAGRRQIDRVCPLDYLSVDTVRRCLQDCQLGAYAEQQWIWEQMEQYDPMLMTCLTKRDDALDKYDWSITIKPGLDDRDSLLAEAQQRTINDLCNAIVNMDEAITALSQASRRHYKFLQPYADDDGLHLLPIDNWLMCRDGYRGTWGYNPNAQFGRYRGEVLPVPLDDLILRLHPRPIDMPAQMLVLNRSTTLAQWDVFLERLGTPPLFFSLPPDCSDELRQLYIQAAAKFISAATGVIDHGADLKSVPVSQTSVDLFDRRYKVATEEIAMLTTAGKLTVMTESGSGTLAGGAQADGFADWAAGESSSIASVLTAQLVNRVLDEYHPGQPHLVEFTLSCVDKTTPDKEIANAAALRAAGYDIDDAEVSERTGWQVTAGVSSSQLYAIKAAGYVPQQQAMEDVIKLPLQPAPQETPYTLNSRRRDALTTLALHRSTTLWEPARRRLEEVVAHRLQDIDKRLERVTLEMLPLSPEEQAQLALMLQVPGEEEIVSTALQIARRLQEARNEGRRRAAAIDPSLTLSTPARPLHGANSANPTT